MSTDSSSSCCGGEATPEKPDNSPSCCGSSSGAARKDHAAADSCHTAADTEKSACCDTQSAAQNAPVAASSCCGSAVEVKQGAGDSCHVEVSSRATTSSCCGTEASSTEAGGGCCDTGGKQRVDWIFWICTPAVVIGYISYFLFGLNATGHDMSGHESSGTDMAVYANGLPDWLNTMFMTSHEMVNAMWWGILSAAFFVGLLGRIPRELVMSVLGKAGTGGGVVRATIAGLMLDLCNHGILMVGMKLYERGASIGQVMAFLIASPWNSLTLTLILVGLIGLPWTLLFILGSLLIAWVSGLIFDALVRRGTLPENPHGVVQSGVQFMPALKQTWAENDWRPASLLAMFWQGLKESRTVLRWVVFGVVLVALIRAFVPEDSFGVWFGASMTGLLLTLLATTLIEVCSEGSSPIAADLFNRAGAPGNAFTFLMAGAATDYTEIMSLRDTTRSWKIALFLPLVTVPQVLLIGWLMNLSV